MEKNKETDFGAIMCFIIPLAIGAFAIYNGVTKIEPQRIETQRIETQRIENNKKEWVDCTVTDIEISEVKGGRYPEGYTEITTINVLSEGINKILRIYDGEWKNDETLKWISPSSVELKDMIEVGSKLSIPRYPRHRGYKEAERVDEYFTDEIIIISGLSSPKKLNPQPLSQKPFSVEYVEVFDILNSENGEWRKSEVYVYAENWASSKNIIMILTCDERDVISKFRDNLKIDTLVALYNFDKAVKGRIVNWAGKDYQEYYLDSVSDIAIIQERGDFLDEMWRMSDGNI